jgi:hypothetical protein
MTRYERRRESRHLLRELRGWLLYWGGSAAGIILIGSLCAWAHVQWGGG